MSGLQISFEKIQLSGPCATSQGQSPELVGSVDREQGRGNCLYIPDLGLAEIVDGWPIGN